MTSRVATSAAQLDARQRYTIPETNAFLRQSRAKTYQDISSGSLAVIRDGRRVYIPGSEIIRRSSLKSA
jgi:hypothetical protein